MVTVWGETCLTSERKPWLSTALTTRGLTRRMNSIMRGSSFQITWIPILLRLGPASGVGQGSTVGVGGGEVSVGGGGGEVSTGIGEAVGGSGVPLGPTVSVTAAAGDWVRAVLPV